MATANDIIARAFSRAGIKASEAALEPDEIQDGLDLLNDMLSNWEPIHHLGFSPVAGVADEIRIPRFANAAVIDAFAIVLSPEYHKPVSQGLAASAKLSMDNMMSANINLDDVDMPSTLPLGSGNECSDSGDDSRFFAQKDKVNF
jgi:hypothetical protein